MGSRWRHLPIWETSISERCSESLSKSSGSPYVCSLSFLCAARGVLPPPQAGSRDYEHKENEPLYFFISKILLFPLKETNLPKICHLQDGQPSLPDLKRGTLADIWTMDTHPRTSITSSSSPPPTTTKGTPDDPHEPHPRLLPPRRHHVHAEEVPHRPRGLQARGL